MKLFAATALALLLIGNAHAYNVLIDFEDSPLTGDLIAVPNPIDSQGFNFSGTTNKSLTNWPLGPVDESKALMWQAADGGAITMAQDGMIAFDLLSLELAGGSYNSPDVPTGAPIYLQLTGHLVGGGTISTSLVLTSIELNNFVPGSGWTNLQSLTMYASGGDGFINLAAVDNILVSTVPIPAAVWLFASGLGLLGWLRRRT